MPSHASATHRPGGCLTRLAVLLHPRPDDARGRIDPAAYIIAQNSGLLDNISPLILIYTPMILPIAVWTIRSFLLQLPKEVLEAARVDGAKLTTEMRRIILPIIAWRQR